MKHRIKTGLFLAIFFMLGFTFFDAKAQEEPQQQNQGQPETEGQEDLNTRREVREDFSNKELEKFIEANKNAIVVQQQAEQKMIQAIQDEGLDIQVFNEILTAKQNPEYTSKVTDEEHQKFDKAVKEVVKIQEEMMGEIESAIKDAGIPIQTYEEILVAYQQSPKVQEKVNEMLSNNNGDQ